MLKNYKKWKTDKINPISLDKKLEKKVNQNKTNQSFTDYFWKKLFILCKELKMWRFHS